MGLIKFFVELFRPKPPVTSTIVLEEMTCHNMRCRHLIKLHNPPSIWCHAPCTVEGCECKEAMILLGG